MEYTLYSILTKITLDASYSNNQVFEYQLSVEKARKWVFIFKFN